MVTPSLAARMGLPPQATTARPRQSAPRPTADEDLEAEFQKAAERHADAAAASGAPHDAPAGRLARDYHDMMQEAVDLPSTKRLPSSEEAEGGGPHHRVSTPAGTAPGWQALLHPSKLPEQVAELAEDPLAYPHETAHGKAVDQATVGNDPRMAAPPAELARSALGEAALMGGMVQPAVRGSRAGAELAAHLDSVEEMLNEVEDHGGLHRHPHEHTPSAQPAQKRAQQQQPMAYNNETANLAAGPMAAPTTATGAVEE